MLSFVIDRRGDVCQRLGRHGYGMVWYGMLDEREPVPVGSAHGQHTARLDEREPVPFIPVPS